MKPGTCKVVPAPMREDVSSDAQHLDRAWTIRTDGIRVPAPMREDPIGNDQPLDRAWTIRTDGIRVPAPRLELECNDSDSDSVNRIYHYSAIYYHFQATLTEWKSPTRSLIKGGHFVAQCPFYFCVFIAFLSISNEDFTPDSGIKLPYSVHNSGIIH
jgi:hypothetical protein